jgi:hypothetical protein
MIEHKVKQEWTCTYCGIKTYTSIEPSDLERMVDSMIYRKKDCNCDIPDKGACERNSFLPHCWRKSRQLTFEEYDRYLLNKYSAYLEEYAANFRTKEEKRERVTIFLIVISFVILGKS